MIRTMVPEDSPDSANAPAADFRPSDTSTSAYQLWQIQNLKKQLRQEYLDQWEATKDFTGTGRPVDAILSPAAAWPAPPHGKASFLFFPISPTLFSYPLNMQNFSVSYTAIWNTLCVRPDLLAITTHHITPSETTQRLRSQ